MHASVASDPIIDSAYEWLRRQCRDGPADSDDWDLRFHWATEKTILQQALLNGDYRFAPTPRVTKADGEYAG